jgi:tetratricopeptide (TPR) repeat protein
MSQTREETTMTDLATPQTDPGAGARTRLVVDLRSHRRLRGPYTAGGALLRRIVPELTDVEPARMAALATAVVAIAPDLEPLVPTRAQTLTDLAEPDERTRFYPVQRTRDLAYMVSELVRIWAERHHRDGVQLRWWELADADPTDVQLVKTIRRRLHPATVTVVDAGARPATERLGSAEERAQQYVDDDCTSNDASLGTAYRRLDPEDRARRHSARARLLIERAEPGTHLGAIPFHLERGEDPGQAVRWLSDAQNQAFREGFYHAALDLGQRGRALVSPTEDARTHSYLTKRVIGALTYLNRCDEAIEVIGERRRTANDTTEEMKDAYTMAMIYTRHHHPDRLDNDKALAWVNTALALAEREPDPVQRAFYGAFMRNARALVELRRGDLETALALVDEGLDIFDRQLGEKHELYRTVLLVNRARVRAALGDVSGALLDFDAVLDHDPEYDGPHFERAVAHKMLGELQAALGDLDRAIELNIAFTDAYYNRSDIWTELGRDDLALADLTTLLDIDPGYADGRLNRALLLMGSGDLQAAEADLEHAVSLGPDRADLWTAMGLLRAEKGQESDALAGYQAALERDPRAVEAYANRAVLHFSAGRVADAVADLDRAIELGDQPVLRVNRGIGRHELGDHAGAVADYDAALASASVGDVDQADVLSRRDLALQAARDTAAEARR